MYKYCICLRCVPVSQSAIFLLLTIHFLLSFWLFRVTTFAAAYTSVYCRRYEPSPATVCVFGTELYLIDSLPTSRPITRGAPSSSRRDETFLLDRNADHPGHGTFGEKFRLPSPRHPIAIDMPPQPTFTVAGAPWSFFFVDDVDHLPHRMLGAERTAFLRPAIPNIIARLLRAVAFALFLPAIDTKRPRHALFDLGTTLPGACLPAKP